MSRRIAINDTTLRDGHQSLWATRMTTPMILGVADYIERAGYEAADLSAAANFDACVRYLNEDPWERLRQVRKRLVRTPVHALMRSRNFISFDMVADDLIELTLVRMAANGISRVMVFDGLHDLDHFRFNLEVCKEVGIYAIAAVTFSISPVHTDEYFANKARQILALGARALLLKDPAALLTPDRVRTLVPALKGAAGGLPLEVHTHCLTSLGPLVLLESVSHGADGIWTAIPPLANGYSHPSVFNIAENLRLMGYQVDLDLEPVRRASEFLGAVAAQEGLPVGQVARYDLFHYQHQIPGGVISNLRSMLKDAGMEDKLRQVLEEIPRVRQELGWPVMVSPYSQFVSIQALLNIIHGERYQVVLDEIAKWVYGYYGKLEAPVDPNVMDVITQRASRRIDPVPLPLEPVLPSLRKAYPKADDDELVLRGYFKGTRVDDMLAAQPMKLVYEFRQDLAGLVRRLTAVADTGQAVLSTANLEFCWQR